mmetsp:Transcript_3437/g.7510  ORF Transcript_3437/g.7510 Transcript_3437/m.7510 type:complete len:224 (+) Transcript_3437:721-1392(+)
MPSQCSNRASRANSAQDCPTHRRKESWHWTIEVMDFVAWPVALFSVSVTTSTRIAWVSPQSPSSSRDSFDIARSVANTRGSEKSARNFENLRDLHQFRGTRSTSNPSMSFHRSGAVPMADEEDPAMESSDATVAASGKGQAKTFWVPTRDRARVLSSSHEASSSSLWLLSSWSMKKSTFPRSLPDKSSNTVRFPFSCMTMGSPNPRFVMYRLIVPDPPSPLVK